MGLNPKLFNELFKYMDNILENLLKEITFKVAPVQSIEDAFNNPQDVFRALTSDPAYQGVPSGPGISGTGTTVLIQSAST